MNMINDSLTKAYEYMADVTPLRNDCGKLCDSKCCMGSNDDGMILFPGEEKYFVDKEGFSVYFEERYGYNAVRCNGRCNRKERPLACRIFPYFVYLKRDNSKPSVLPDLRAMDFCPLLTKSVKTDKKFLRALRITALKLCEDSEMSDFLRNMTEIISDFKL